MRRFTERDASWENGRFCVFNWLCIYFFMMCLKNETGCVCNVNIDCLFRCQSANAPRQVAMNRFLFTSVKPFKMYFTIYLIFVALDRWTRCSTAARNHAKGHVGYCTWLPRCHLSILMLMRIFKIAFKTFWFNIFECYFEGEKGNKSFLWFFS